MQLKEHLPFDVRDVMRVLPISGDARHKLRTFTLNPRVRGRARSVERLANWLGFVVEVRHLPRGMNGRLARDGLSKNGYRIEVSSLLSKVARRFAVLHEMGHYFRHEDHDDPFGEVQHFDLSNRAFYVDTKAEREANEFAEAILFGDGQLSAAYTLCRGSIPAVAKYFGVTAPVVRAALAKLRQE